jgi:hypothetical protein
VPLIAGMTTLLVAVAVFLWAWPYLNRNAERPDTGVNPARAEFERLTADGRRALADGSFARARELFDEAIHLRRSRPELLDQAKAYELNQRYWQSDVLANEVALAEVLKTANGFDKDDDWQAQFKLHFRGRSVVFDDVLRRDARGRPVLRERAEVRWNKVRGRVDVDDLRLLARLPPEPAQRWIFGARLASVTRETDEWVIRFEPDSGVLLTDADAVKAWNPALKQDPELGEVLERQGKLAQKLVVPEP